MSMRSSAGRIIITALVAAALVVGSVILSTRTFADRTIKPHQLVILFTGDDQGNVKAPCG